MVVKKMSELKINQKALIVKVDGELHIKRRLLELGLTNGTEVCILNISPLKSSYLINVRGYSLALRKNSIDLIGVVTSE